MNIFFDKSLKTKFIQSQKLEMDSSNYLVDSKTQKRIVGENKKAIKAKQFGGIRKGSRIFLAENIDTVIKEASLKRN